MRGTNVRLLGTTLLVVAAFAGHAEAKDFEDVSKSPLTKCPNGFNGLLKKCAIATVITTDGQIMACYCDQNKQYPKDDISGVIPPGDQQEIVSGTLGIGKIIDKKNPQDPCNYLSINGVKRYVCW
jgi:hypothetical protein